MIFMPAIFDVHIAKTTKDTIHKRIRNAVEGDCPYTICTPNPEILLLASRESDYVDTLNSFDSAILDGIGVYIGYKITQSTLPTALKYCILPFWTLQTFLFPR